MLNPESVMPNFFRHLFRAGLFMHLMNQTLNQPVKQVQGMVQKGDKKRVLTSYICNPCLRQAGAI